MRTSRLALIGVMAVALVVIIVALFHLRHAMATAHVVKSTPLKLDAAATAAPHTGGDEFTPVELTQSDKVVAMARRLLEGSSDKRCLQTIKDATEFLDKERSARSADHSGTMDDEHLTAEVDRFKRNLSGQFSEEALLTGFLMDQPERRVRDDPDAVAKLLEFGRRAAASKSPLLAWHALRSCAAAELQCPYADLALNLVNTQPQNAEAWTFVATLKYQRGDVAGALAAMQRAGGAASSNRYWPETAALVERTLATQTTIPYVSRLRGAFGTASLVSPSLRQISEICKKESAGSSAWGEACLGFSKVEMERGNTGAARSSGYSMREQTLRAMGEKERAANAANEHARYKAERAEGGIELMQWKGRLQGDLIESDPARLKSYLNAVGTLGEVDGIREFLTQEVPSLMARSGLLERDGSRECVAQLLGAPQEGGPGLLASDRPIQIGDELHISISGLVVATRPLSLTTMRRVGSDGEIILPSFSPIKAIHKTTEQLQRDIANLLSSGDRPPEIRIVVIPSRAGVGSPAR